MYSLGKPSFNYTESFNGGKKQEVIWQVILSKS